MDDVNSGGDMARCKCVVPYLSSHPPNTMPRRWVSLMHNIYNPCPSLYDDRLYQLLVADAAEESMKAAVECVKASPHYATS